MSGFCFLLDENLPRSLQTALWRAEEWRNVTAYLPFA